MASVTSPTLPRRLLLGAVLVVVAFAGAGLASAADRPHTEAQRPELTARADLSFQPWRERLTTELRSAATELSALSTAGREVLGSMYQLDLDALGSALLRGGDAAAQIDARRQAVLDVRLAQAGQLPDSRLGERNRSFLAAVDAATEGLAAAPGAWATLAATAGIVVELVGAIEQHDALVLDAASAGRSFQWTQALDRLEAASGALARARAVRDRIAAAGDVTTLDDLLARYAAYDAALARLYTELEGGAALDSPAVTALREEADRALAALPTDDSALRVVVAEAAGSAAAQPLVVIEQARGAVAEAVGEEPETAE